MIDIHRLPQEAQDELIDFYQFLLERYVSGKRKRKVTSVDTDREVNIFFDQYNIDLGGFTFNRDELYAR